MDYDKLSFVLAGSLRQRVVKALAKPKTPTQILVDVKTNDSSLSRTLGELEHNEIVTCLFPKNKKGRIYKLTKAGEQILIGLL